MNRTIRFSYPEDNVLEHPSDVGLEVRGETLSIAIERLIECFYSLQLKRAEIISEIHGDLTVCAMDLESLVVRLLSELLYRFQGERKVWRGKITVEDRGEQVCVIGDGVEVLVEIGEGDVIEDLKAVTYHNIAVVEDKNGWRIRVFFDI